MIAEKNGKGRSLCSEKGAMAGKVFVVVAILAFITLSIIFWHGLKVKFMDGIMWVNHLGIFWGSIVLISTNVIGALLCAPCLPFTLAAGFLYGFLYGTAVVTISTTLAALVAFITARYFVRDFVAQQWGSSARFRALDSAIKADGFRIVFLIRSSPAHPYGVCNYLFGLTSVTLWDYGVGGFLAMLPATFVEVYIGTAVKSVAELIHGSAEESMTERVFFWAGLVVTLFSIIYTSRWLKKKLDSELIAYEEVSVQDDADMSTADPETGADDSPFSTSPRHAPMDVTEDSSPAFVSRHRDRPGHVQGGAGSINSTLAPEGTENGGDEMFILSVGGHQVGPSSQAGGGSFVIPRNHHDTGNASDDRARARTVSSEGDAHMYLNTDRILNAIGSGSS